MVSLRKKHPIVQKIHKVLLEKYFDGAWINQVYQLQDCLHVQLHLPEHKELKELEKVLPNLQQELGATGVKLGKTKGKSIEVLFGMRELGTVPFSSSLLHPDSLKVTFPSSFGETVLDFEDGASCHMLNGGATRMGKTILLLYLTTSLFVQNEGNIKLYISSAKLKDYYPFQGLPQVKMAKDMVEMDRMLTEIVNLYKDRDKLLYSPALEKATDAKDVRKYYPDQYHHFKPVFLVVDEYARFAEHEGIQEKVTELVETAGFVNIHVVLASQRPDATTVLVPRLRANLMVRMAFTTVDKKNSEIILDKEGAEQLGEIPGRALLRDSGFTTVQVPYIDQRICEKLIEPYRSVTYVEPTGCSNPELPETISSVESESTGEIVLPSQQKPPSSSQSGVKTIKARRKNPGHSSSKGIVLPVYAEPDYDSPE